MPHKDPEAKKAYARRYWNDNADMRADHAARKIERLRELKAWYREFKKTLRCERCSEWHPACLQFHHLDGEDKSHEISRMVMDGRSKESILAEIAKCMVLCANCHAKEHWVEMI